MHPAAVNTLGRTDGQVPKAPVLTVIVPALNAFGTIEDQLAALENQEDPGVPWEVLVVDNGSTDDTPVIVRRYLARNSTWRTVEAPREHNLAYARNVGVDHARGSLIAFADADDVVAAQWATAVVDALREHPLVAFAFEYDLLNEPSSLVGRARFQSLGVESFFGLPVVSGALGIRRHVWEAVGGNDETWSFTGEDYDFCFRVARELRIVPAFAPRAVYHVRLRGDARGTFRQAQRYGRSHAALYARYVVDREPPSKRLAEAARAWWWIATRAPVAAADPTRRMRWARTAGLRSGRISESLRQPVLCP